MRLASVKCKTVTGERTFQTRAQTHGNSDEQSCGASKASRLCHPAWTRLRTAHPSPSTRKNKKANRAAYPESRNTGQLQGCPKTGLAWHACVSSMLPAQNVPGSPGCVSCGSIKYGVMGRHSFTKLYAQTAGGGAFRSGGLDGMEMESRPNLFGC